MKTTGAQWVWYSLTTATQTLQVRLWQVTCALCQPDRHSTQETRQYSKMSPFVFMSNFDRHSLK